MVGLPDGEKVVRICVTVSTQYTNVTNIQQDGHRTTARAALMHISRSKDIIFYYVGHVFLQCLPC